MRAHPLGVGIEPVFAKARHICILPAAAIRRNREPEREVHRVAVRLVHLKPVREKIRIDCRLASRRLASVAGLVGVNLAELGERRIAHHERTKTR